MKANRILKSLSELSPELLAAEAAGPEQTKPQQAQMVPQETQQTPSSFVIGPDTRGSRRWGINE
jgi:hypothetical protein